MLQLLLRLIVFGYSFGLYASLPSLEWDYQRQGPDAWPHAYSGCGGEFQSPINIRTCLVRYDPNLSPLSLHGYAGNGTLHAWNFTHNRRTIVAQPLAAANISISGANLPGHFSLVQFHLHWGYNPYQGSEHTINGVKFPLEIHFVHESRSGGGMAVLGVLFELEEYDNSYINELLHVFNQTARDSASVIKNIDLSPLFPVLVAPNFYRYDGSLTTPPCTEGVNWILFASTVPISANQLKVFINNSEPFNFRPPQRLHSRRVSANFRVEQHKDQDDEDAHTSTCRSSLSVQRVSTFRTLVVSFMLARLRTNHRFDGP